MDEHEVHRAKGQFKFGEFFSLINQVSPKYWLMSIGVLIGLVGTAINLVVPKIAANLINTFSKGIDYHLLLTVIILFILSSALSVVGGALLGFFGQDVVSKLRQKIWAQLMILRVSYFDEVKAGEMSSRLVNDSSQVQELLASKIPSALSAILTVIGAVFMMFTMDWHMSLVVVASVPVAVVLLTPLMLYAGRLSRKRQDAIADFNGSASEVLGEIRLVKSSNAEKQATQSTNGVIGRLYQIGLRETVYDAAMGPIMMMIMMGMVFGLLAFGIYRVSHGAMTIGTLTSFLMYIFNLIGAVPLLGTVFSEMSKAAGATTRIREILREPQEDFTAGDSINVEGQTLRASHVDFGYTTEENILTDVSFEAKPNTVIAFAGPSGGGKSTIFSLVERFYEPTSGIISIGDSPLNQVNLASWRSQIGFVSQDSAILAGTIRDNLTFGLSGEYSDEQLWHVLSLAYAKTFVAEMPAQLETQVGERGIKVSGGQRQRLAIARAFLRDPKILMLDEATASLDSQSEAMVQKALERLMANRTTLVIAHRLSTIVGADQIYFIEHGRVSGFGTHQELMSNHPLYREYVQGQAINQ
ncbi:ABC transporter ATP-binding protein [Leuconostoc citreum]|uniref:ABC transporter ATP-binding protein n=1 Tax=Leuconostoc citreum TaxID=33964 RepID=UPI0011BB685A|nr:ABC transporter ATP-binding protein [Leuconostoc citreum]QEA46216.1 ABC transporter ATP-binding protein [Leuconostoc citreum]QEA62907.1 ABC transporter ATP-binding protein [Leuconostoc citreum]